MKLKEVIGRVLYRTAGKWPYVPGPAIRAFCAKLVFAHCGHHVKIRPNARLSREISLGDYSEVGPYAYLGGDIRIGDYVMMGRDVKIIVSNHRSRDTEVPMKLQGWTKVRPVVIGDDVWIGSNVIILPGVHVGKGAILGAGAVIREDVPPYAIMIGNPAYVLRYRKAPDAPAGENRTE